MCLLKSLIVLKTHGDLWFPDQFPLCGKMKTIRFTGGDLRNYSICINIMWTGIVVLTCA